MFDDNVDSSKKYPTIAKYSVPMRRAEREIVGRQKEIQTLMASLSRPELCNPLLLGEAGSGKALSDMTLIPVADERKYVPIMELVVGDRVFGASGESVVVQGVYPQGPRRAYRVITSLGQEIICNDEHLWTVRDTASASYETLTLREMMDRGITQQAGAGAAQPRFVLPAACAVQWPVAGPGEDRSTGSIAQRREYLFDEFSVDVPEGTAQVHISGFQHRHMLEVRRILGSLGFSVRIMHEVDGRTSDERDFLVPEDDTDIVQTYRIMAFRLDEIEISEVLDCGYDVGMTCIRVDAADSLFQASENHLVTHNTALVQGAMLVDTDREYREIDLSRMVDDLKNTDEMAGRIKALFDEASNYYKNEHRELVMFMDEFHQVVQLSSAAVEALKPGLAASGSLGVRIIAATTYDEFHKFITPNQALVERLQRINVSEPNRKATVGILRNMADKWNVGSEFDDDSIFELIYEYSNRYIPASAQPRKSLQMLDAMIGWHRITGHRMDRELLSKVVEVNTGANVAFSVDAPKIKQRLDRVVLKQEFATSTISRRLQLCVADLNDKTRPQSSFLFIGPTGVGKACTNSTRLMVMTSDGQIVEKDHGTVAVGDRVPNRRGEMVPVAGVFPQGTCDVYRVTLTDGRRVDVNGQHLWGVATAKTRRSYRDGNDLRVMTTLELFESGVVTKYQGSDRRHLKYFVPMNGAVDFPHREFVTDPYVIGVAIGDGLLTSQHEFVISSVDEGVVKEVSQRLGAVSYVQNSNNYSWTFSTADQWGSNGRTRNVQNCDVCGEFSEIYLKKSPERRIPRAYMYGSIAQRWDLVKGLFDTDGTVDGSSARRNVSYSTLSKGLAEDIQELLYSLGVSSSVNEFTRVRDGQTLPEYRVHVRVGNENKYRFFTPGASGKYALACSAEEAGGSRQRVKSFDMVGISDIEKLDVQEEMTCIYIDDPEHLYQAGQYVVTHNTEMSKQLARLLFGDAQRHLIRFDMTEFSQSDSVGLFKSELTKRIKDRPFAVILLDEIEKADPVVVRALLPVLDDGRMTDDHNREVTFKNAYIIMTTNAGNETHRSIAQYETNDMSSGKTMAKYMANIRRSLREGHDGKFPPELLGRIDVLVSFNPLQRQTIEDIVKMQLEIFYQNLLVKHGVRLSVHPKVLQYLVEDKSTTDSDEGGARDVMRKLTEEVMTEVAQYINKNPAETAIHVAIDGELVSDNKSIRESDAKVVVRPAIRGRTANGTSVRLKSASTGARVAS